MKVIPAIDLLAGKAVRLRKGLRNEVTVFHDEPWKLVRQFADQGAEMIHVVDLDGAFSGARAHSDIVRRIVDESPVPVQVGGGVRDRAALDAVFAVGAARAVLGTAAIKSPLFVQDACATFPDAIVVAVDAKEGVVAVEGWTESSTVSAVELGKRAAAWGAAALLYTDVARDGMHSGPNVQATADLARAVGARTPVIASGGVSSLADLRNLARSNIPYVVVGRALYDQHFTLLQAIAAAAETEC